MTIVGLVKEWRHRKPEDQGEEVRDQVNALTARLEAILDAMDSGTTPPPPTPTGHQ